ncbi:MAG: RluA family pseudouridine synthase [Armatimonadia bacterium]|nr:RluA family pseudouridine synthase [Armatimonadia bacterium]
MEPTASLELAVREAKGERLDKFVSQLVPHISRSRIQRAIETGEITVHGSLERASYRLKRGDVVRVDIGPETEVETDIIPEDIPLDILYEDDELIVLNKQANLIVHPAPGIDRGTLVNGLVAHCPKMKSTGVIGRPGLVHRLDKDTTGVIMVAKSEFAHTELSEQIRLRQVDKTYHAVCYGHPQPEEGVVNAPIGRHPVDRKKMAVVEESRRGRHALSSYRTLETYPGMSLLEVDIETGRTHQIRVHLNHIGHSVVGDPQYGRGKARPSEIKPRDWDSGIGDVVERMPGQALHARRLSFRHPTTEEIMTFEAPWKDHFAELLETLRELRQEMEEP